MRRLLRVACFAGCERVFTTGDINDTDLCAIAMSGAKAEPLTDGHIGESQIALIAAADGANPELIARAAIRSDRCIIVMLDPGIRESVTPLLPEAMVFTGKHSQESYMIISRNRLPAANYRLTFT